MVKVANKAPLLKLMKRVFLVCVVTLAIVISHINQPQPSTSSFLIVDTHIDTPYRNFRNELNIFDGTGTGQFDVPRAQHGGLSTVFMSIYTPASAATEGSSKTIAIELMDWVEAMANSSDAIGMATCVADVRQLHEDGIIGFAMGLENGSPLAGDLSDLAYFVNRGIRYVTLAHSKSNKFSDSSYDENEVLEGLSAAGRELVRELNRRGVMIDISHLSDRAAWEVLELSSSPVIASHSSLRHFIPGFHRNISDEMVAAIRKNDGVIQINFGSSFVLQASRQWRTSFDVALADERQRNEITGERYTAFYREYAEKHPFPFATVATVVDHIDRVVDLAGIDHVGLGSDFDGVGDTLPIDLKDVSMYPNLITELRQRGYDDDALRKILGENLMRVWEANEAIASSYGYEPNCAQT